MLKKVQDGIQRNLKGLVQRERALRAYLNTTVYRQYQNAQLKRWMTEGASEGRQWAPLSRKYAVYKRLRYGGGPRFTWVGGSGEGRPWVRAGNWPTYPGAGTKMLIATGRLVSGVIGPMKNGSIFGMSASAKDHRKIVGARSIEIRYVVPYGQDVHSRRNFEGLSENTNRLIVKDLMRFLVNNTMPKGLGDT